jgi:hypothetical protein
VSYFSVISWREQVTFRRYNDDVRLVLDQHAELDFPVDCCISELTSKTGWLGIRIMYLMGAIYLPVDCCISELALKK